MDVPISTLSLDVNDFHFPFRFNQSLLFRDTILYFGCNPSDFTSHNIETSKNSLRRVLGFSLVQLRLYDTEKRAAQKWMSPFQPSLSLSLPT